MSDSFARARVYPHESRAAVQPIQELLSAIIRRRVGGVDSDMKNTLMNTPGMRIGIALVVPLVSATAIVDRRTRAKLARVAMIVVLTSACARAPNQHKHWRKRKNVACVLKGVARQLLPTPQIVTTIANRRTPGWFCPSLPSPAESWPKEAGPDRSQESYGCFFESRPRLQLRLRTGADYVIGARSIG